jgi:hypothetical protein
MAKLRCFLLGPPRFERDGVSLQIDRHKNVALVAYLAVTGGSHTREALTTLLWPEVEPGRARAGLRRNLSALRAVLRQAQDATHGGEWLLADRETVGTNPDAGLWLDVHAFRDRLATWRGHDHGADVLCPDCLAALVEAVELYRGGPSSCTGEISWKGSACATAPSLTSGSSFRPRACARNWPPPWSGWCAAMATWENTNGPSPTPGAGWRSILCTSRHSGT